MLELSYVDSFQSQVRKVSYCRVMHAGRISNVMLSLGSCVQYGPICRDSVNCNDNVHSSLTDCSASVLFIGKFTED